MPLWLSRDDVARLLPMDEAIAAMEEAYALLAQGEAVQPLRINMATPDGSGSLLAMPAYLGGSVQRMGTKLVTLFGANPAQRGLPAIQGCFALFHGEDGRLLAVMDAAHLTAMRTGAASGVATKHLARPDARVVTLFGAGAQAETQLQAVCAVRPVERVLVVARRPESAARFAQRMGQQLGIPVEPVREPVQDVAQAVAAADILITATSAHQPLFDGAWLRPGVHINSIGAHTPDARELDDATIRRATIVTDLTSACLSETGDLVQPIQAGLLTPEQIHGEIGEIVLGRKPGRTSPEEITLFKSVGLAVQDVAAGHRVYQRARAEGVGLEVALD